MKAEDPAGLSSVQLWAGPGVDPSEQYFWKGFPPGTTHDEARFVVHVPTAGIDPWFSAEAVATDVGGMEIHSRDLFVVGRGAATGTCAREPAFRGVRPDGSDPNLCGTDGVRLSWNPPDAWNDDPALASARRYRIWRDDVEIGSVPSVVGESGPIVFDDATAPTDLPSDYRVEAVGSCGAVFDGYSEVLRTDFASCPSVARGRIVAPRSDVPLLAGRTIELEIRASDPSGLRSVRAARGGEAPSPFARWEFPAGAVRQLHETTWLPVPEVSGPFPVRLRVTGASSLAEDEIPLEVFDPVPLDPNRSDWESAFAGQVVVVDGGTLRQDAPARLGGLILLGGARIVPATTSTASAPAPVLDLRIDGLLYVGPGSAIDATGGGWVGGSRGGNTAKSGLASSPTGGSEVGAPSGHGGSHAGLGGSNGDFAGDGRAVGHPLRPGLPGGGGGATSAAGGNGGGVVRIVAGRTVIDGTILAGGESASAGGGAGGSVSLDVETLDGDGSIGASGGNGQTGGGGGRVAISVRGGSIPAPLRGRIEARGGAGSSVRAGSSGGAGTVYLVEGNDPSFRSGELAFPPVRAKRTRCRRFHRQEAAPWPRSIRGRPFGRDRRGRSLRARRSFPRRGGGRARPPVGFVEGNLPDHRLFDRRRSLVGRGHRAPARGRRKGPAAGRRPLAGGSPGRPLLLDPGTVLTSRDWLDELGTSPSGGLVVSSGASASGIPSAPGRSGSPRAGASPRAGRPRWTCGPGSPAGSGGTE